MDLNFETTHHDDLHIHRIHIKVANGKSASGDFLLALFAEWKDARILEEGMSGDDDGSKEFSTGAPMISTGWVSTLSEAAGTGGRAAMPGACLCFWLESRQIKDRCPCRFARTCSIDIHGCSNINIYIYKYMYKDILCIKLCRAFLTVFQSEFKTFCFKTFHFKTFCFFFFSRFCWNVYDAYICKNM